MKNLKLKVFTTKKSKRVEKDVKEYVKEINENIKDAKIVDVDVEYVSGRKLKPVVNKKSKRFSWSWFIKEFTSKAEGYDVVSFHCSYRYKKKWGVKTNLNGTYRNDKDGIIEFWFCDRRKYAKDYKPKITEFKRLFLHELLHGFYRHTGIDSNLVHTLDYKMKNLLLGYKMVDYEK